MHFWRRHLFSTLTLAALCAAGCGQTGRLYLPDEPREQLPPQTDGAASGTERADSESEQRKKRSGTDDTPATDTHTPVSPPDPDRPAAPPPPEPQGR
jgi:predicted small lipoprotein YifL